MALVSRRAVGESISGNSMLVLMLLRALAGCRLEAELFVPDVPARVGDIGAYPDVPAASNNVRIVNGSGVVSLLPVVNHRPRGGCGDENKYEKRPFASFDPS
jgi:predicted small lipoprotein YifL